MSARPRAVTLLLGLVTAASPALGQVPALPPSEAELRTIGDDVSARARREATSQRARVRPFVELGVSVWRGSTWPSGSVTLERQPGAAPMLALGLRRGLGPVVELDLRLEAVAPVAVAAFPAPLAQAAAAQPCAGSRRFDLPAASALDVALAAAVRARLFRATSAFYVGLGLRLAGTYADARGPAVARCEGASPAPPPAQAEVTDTSWAVRADAGLETGYRFGDHEAWDVGLRMVVSAVGTNNTRVGGAQWFVAWHFH